ncbi:dihydrolipoyl dehydrogenase [Thiohalophilus thiocyanatoxydans]|uniref:Dihydrolipoyl dehydrogenase n=1 Tax=Thiohalophilus thiocyanatoxydans TaxID=381308 RepID=A0A4R8IU08_9GAMM|nr:dihydrolipoyl dehydrogenase [Thiohalophilus thiocyanatoxydans]TDY03914.1 dihydrolipoamide dehydrogenase [Thiohalophilus thiocyanatoxydans]
MSEQYDVIVIGAGPAGYVAAIRCAQLGFNVACIDDYLDEQGQPSPGGTCLNIGCIPSKALLESSHHYQQAEKQFAEHGIRIGQLVLDLATMQNRKQKVVRDLTGGIQSLFKANQIAFYAGRGTLKQNNRVEVIDHDNNSTTLNAEHVILASGSRPAELPFAPFDGKQVVDSTGGLAFDSVPQRLGIIGAGVIGLELGSVWQRLGAEVIVLEAQERFLPDADPAIAKQASKLLGQQGLDIRLGSNVESVNTDKTVQVAYTDGQGSQHLEFDKLIVAVGRRPNSEALCAGDLALTTDQRGFVQVDDHYRTNLDRVYAVGDLIPGPMLAHKGMEEGMAVAEQIAGQFAEVDYDNIPLVIYTHPEIAWTGRSEQQLKEAGIDYTSGQFPFSANGRARAAGETDGLIKVLADAHTDRVLGVHMIGPGCSELIGQAVIARAFGASSEDLALTMFAHPTLSETLHEAMLDVAGRAIHRAPSRKKRP